MAMSLACERPHHVECLDRFSEANTNSYRASLLLSSLVVFALWGYLPHGSLLVWLLAVWGAQTAHEAYSRYYRRFRRSDPGKCSRWLRGFWLGAVVVGVCWSLPFFIFDALADDVVSLLVFAIAGVTAYGGVARATVLSVALVFEFATVLPMCVWLFQQGSVIYRIMAAAALLYLALLVPLLRKMNQMVTRTLVLDGENLRSAQEYLALAANLPVAVIRYDAQQRRRYINPTAQKMLHGNTPHMLGLVPGEGGVPATPAMITRYRGMMAEVLATGEPREFDFALDALPEGSQKQYEVRMVPEQDADGNIAGALAIWFDITERKKMEQMLAEREAFLKVLLDAIAVPVFYKDAGGRYLGVNRAFEQFFGCQREGLIGKSVFDTHPRELAETYHAMDAEVLEQRVERQEYESQIKRSDGTLRDVVFSKAAFTDAGGQVRGLIGAVMDITERKQAEAALQERYERIVELHDRLQENACTLEEQAVELEASKEQLMQTEAWYRGILQSAPDGMVVVDAQGVIRLVNVQLCRMFGYQDRELVGQAIEWLVPFDMRNAHVAQRSGFIGSDSPGRPMASGQGGLRARRKDGSEFFVDVSLARLPKVEGAVGTVCASVRDVTERRHMESALAKREQEFRTLVENSVDKVARYGRDLRRVYANPAFAALVEGGASALLGSKPTECPGGANAAMYENKLAGVFAQGVGTEFESHWTDRTGRETCTLISLTPEFDAEGQVASVLSVGRDITELNAFRHKIHQMAFYDTLTGLPNRALFGDRLRQMITDASWHGQQAGLMMLDMDRFKAVNDTLGHAAGDELLREAATRLGTCVRAYDTVARLGGDEFAILLPEMRAGDDLGRIASKVLTAFERPFLLAGKEVFVSCSIGIVLYPDDGVEADDLLKYADSAMYSAKRSGRNNFRFYSRDMTDNAHERLALESDLRRAIERDELVLFYQPKVDLCDGALIGSEALLRWQHPERGLLPPDTFIGIAEDSGLIVEMGEWVLFEACRMAHRWNGDGKPLHKVAINLSARQFQWGDLAGTVRRALSESGCRAEWIELEITESLLLEDDNGVLDVLNSFRVMGVSIAIDDFGTGYSALSYLTRFPIETLKIDRSFISHVTTDKYRAELVKAILSIARCLGQQVVAEGVETEAQANFLRAHGCQVAQGYLYGKPMAVAEFECLPMVFSR